MRTSPLFENPDFVERGKEFLSLFQQQAVSYPSIILPALAYITRDLDLTSYEGVSSLSEQRFIEIGKHTVFSLVAQLHAEETYADEVAAREQGLRIFIRRYEDHPIAVMAHDHPSSASPIVYSSALDFNYREHAHGYLRAGFSGNRFFVNRRARSRRNFGYYTVQAVDYNDQRPLVHVAIGDPDQ